MSLSKLVTKLEAALRKCNPFIRDFVSICKQPIGEEFKFVIDAEKRPEGEHARRYNAPTGLQEVSVFLQNYEGQSTRHIFIKKTGGTGLTSIPQDHRSFDCLHYLLLFPSGHNGWTPQIENLIENSPHKRITLREFYAFHLHQRVGSQCSLLQAARLFQEYCCMGYARIRHNTLHYAATHQKTMRCDTYDSVRKHVASNNTSEVGTPTVLPSSFTGSPRQMIQKFQDASQVCIKKGSPDVFMTVTCNTKWPELTAALLPGQIAADRPDLTARVFKGKIDAIMNDIKGGSMGKIVAHVSVIEFQKRGLPHCHILIFFDERSKLRTPDDVDSLISAEIPTDRAMQKFVIRAMMHNECEHD